MAIKKQMGGGGGGSWNYTQIQVQKHLIKEETRASRTWVWQDSSGIDKAK